MTFGDHDPADTLDRSGEEPDLEQVARKLHEINRDLARLAGREHPEWHEVDAELRLLGAYIVGELLDWLERHGH